MSNQFSPPGARDPGKYDPAVDDATIARGLFWSRIVAVVMMLTAILHAAAMMQIVLFAYRQQPELVCGEVSFVVFGLALLLTGPRVYDASFVSCLLGAAAGLAGGAFAAVWFLFLLFWAGTLSPIAMFLAPASALAGVLAAILAPTARGVERARARMLED